MPYIHFDVFENDLHEFYDILSEENKETDCLSDLKIVKHRPSQHGDVLSYKNIDTISEICAIIKGTLVPLIPIILLWLGKGKRIRIRVKDCMIDLKNVPENNAKNIIEVFFKNLQYSNKCDDKIEGQREKHRLI